MSEDATLLFANDAFYAAFAAGDAEAMGAVWSEREPVFCLHPGWPLLSGRDAIMQSWRGIFSPGRPAIEAEVVTHTRDDALGLVFCNERLGQGLLIASNLFRLEDGRWRLFHHQAGPRQGAARRKPQSKTLQ